VLLCGAGAVRGGGVSGIGGHNAAMAVLDAARGASGQDGESGAVVTRASGPGT
jgi:hypothetical protein